MESNRKLKECLKNNEQVVGTWCFIPHEIVSNIIGKAGMNFIIIDMEHGPMDFEKACAMTMAVQAEGAFSIVRVPYNDLSHIQRALEIGCDGIIVPNIETEEQLKKVIEYSKYPPIGNRGFSPYTRSGSYHSSQNHTTRENDSNVLAIMVEGEKGISNLERFLTYKELDVIYLGSYDISCRIGMPGQVRDPKVVQILKQSAQIIKKAGKIAGCMGNTREELDELRSIGFDFLLYGVDVYHLYNAYRVLSDSRKIK